MRKQILIIFLFCLTAFQSALSQEIPITLAAGIDITTNAKKEAVFNLWQEYVDKKISSDSSAVDLWNTEEKRKYNSVDLMDNAGFLTPSLYGLVSEGGKNVVLSIEPWGEFYLIKSMFYFTYPDETIYPLATVKYLAGLENGNFKLFNYSDFHTKNWYSRKVGSINYIYHQFHPFDKQKAVAANEFYQKLSQVFEVPIEEITYFIAPNCNEIFRMQGFDFVIGMGSDNNLCGFFDFQNNIVYSNTVNGENFQHEIAHTVLKRFPNSGVFHLGLVAYLGNENAHFNKSLNYHIKRINDYLKGHPEIDLNDFLSFNYLDEFTNPQYILPAIICHIILEEKGISGLKELLSYGSGKEYLVIENLLGIHKNELNKFFREKIEFYATKGLEVLL